MILLIMGISKNPVFNGLNPLPFSIPIAIGREGYAEFLEMPLYQLLKFISLSPCMCIKEQTYVYYF
jgi:hypothetical protein